MKFRCVLLALMFSSTLASLAYPEGKPRIRALLVGVGSYKNPEAWARLDGPPKDALRIKKTLMDRYGASEDRITLLSQEQATGANIQKSLVELVDSAQAGDTLIFFYAGHGFVTPNRVPPPGALYEKDDPEDGGVDECLIPIDAPKPDDPTFPDSVVRDDLFEVLLQKAVKKVRPEGKGPGSAIFLFDCCHSGSMSRSANALGKVVRTNLKYRAALTQPTAPAQTSAILKGTRHAAGESGWVVLSACNSRQTAKEDPAHGGDFTNALVTALEDPRLGPDSNYFDLMRIISSTPYFFEQNPVAEGDRDMTILGGSARRREAFLSVVGFGQADKTVVLDRGRLLGLTPGTRIGLYKVGARSAEEKDKFLTEAVVTEQGTDLYRATAQIQGGDNKELLSAVGWVLEQNFGQVEVSIFWDPKAESLAKLVDDPVVKKVSRGGDASLLAWNEAGKLRLERKTGGDLLEATSDPTIIRRALRREAQRLYLTRMVNQPQSLEVELLPGRFTGTDVDSFKASGVKPGADGRHVFGKGDQALLKVRNKITAPLYISVLNFTAEGSVKVIYPYGVEAQKKLEPNQTLLVDLSFDGGKGEEGFKVLGTSQEVDLLFLQSQGKERSAAQPQATLNNPFGQLMTSVMSGTRASRPTIQEPSNYVAREILWTNLK